LSLHVFAKKVSQRTSKNTLTSKHEHRKSNLPKQFQYGRRQEEFSFGKLQAHLANAKKYNL
jgi:hypothetical protein